MILTILLAINGLLCLYNSSICTQYARGMAEYSRLNHVKNNFITMRLDLLDEVIEFLHELRDAHFQEALLEFFDVWHCIIKCFLLLFSPLLFYEGTWKIMTIIVPFYTIRKHALRYRDTRCIRSESHHLVQDHICNYSRTNHPIDKRDSPS